MRLLFVDSNHPVLHETLIEAGFICDTFWDKSTDELLKILPLYDGLVIRSRFKITREIIDRCPQLKCIARVGAGLENIDINYANSKGIKCLSVPEGNRDAVGEHALAMLLMLMNNLKNADEEVRRGIWLRAENRGVEIKGKTVGIIGFGNMGCAFAKKLRGFDCTILAHDKYKTGFGNECVKEASLNDLFKHADIVSIHLPLNDETHYYVDDVFLTQFKKPIYLINTARGACVNTKDLINAIERGQVRGVCLDVLEYESLSFESIPENEIPEPMKYLINSDKVILSPHIAGWTHESNYNMSRLIAEKIIALGKT